MRLFLKHLFRSIRSKATQPIVLVLTILLSTFVSLFALTMNDMILEEILTMKSLKYGSSDIAITLNANTKSRIMFVDDLDDLISDQSKAVGCFDVVGFYGAENNTVFCCATELSSISSIFDLRLKEAEQIPEFSVNGSILISSDFADENNLSLGDSIELEIGGVKKSYIVCGISEGRFMSSYDIMLNIVGVMRIFTANSPLLAILGDSFKPSSVIYIDLPEGADTDSYISSLYESDKFEDKDIISVDEQVHNLSDTRALSAPMTIAVILSALLTAAVAFTCFYILSLQRTEENEAFSYAGAKRKILVASQYIEVFLYLIVGGGLGLISAVLMCGWIAPVAGYDYARGEISFKNVLITLSLILAMLVATVTVFTVASSPKRRKSIGKPQAKNDKLFTLIPVIAFVAMYLVFLFVLKDKDFVLFVVTMVLSLLCAFVLAPHILTAICERANRRNDSRVLSCHRPKHPSVIYAIKNLVSLKIIKNTSRLLVVLVGMLLSITVAALSYIGNIESSKSLFNGDYAVLGATDSCNGKLSECQTVGDMAYVYFGRYQHDNGVTANIIATDHLSFLSEKAGLTSLPKDNELIISRSNAMMLHKSVGDTLTLKLNGKSVDFVVSEIVLSSTPIIVVDAEYAELSYNMILASSASGVDKDAMYEEITTSLALEMVNIVSPQRLLENTFKNVQTFVNSGIILLIVGTIFVCIGMVNNLVESYRARREQFELYRLAGMSRRAISGMKAIELLITFGFGIGFGILVFAFDFFATQSALYSFGVDLYSGFRDFIIK